MHYTYHSGRRALVPAILILLATHLLHASPAEGPLRGRIIDVETNKPISDAAIEVLDTKLHAISGADGSFYLERVQGDSLRFRVTHVAYKENVVVLSVGENESKELVIYLTPKAYELSPIIVTGQHAHSKLDELHDYAGMLQGKELQSALGQTLASTLKNETGLAMRSMGPAPARPVIRGLGGDRVHISEDGVKTTDLSASSPDHAITIEPFSVERIEVLRGPRALLFSPSSIGGVVNVVRHEIPVELHDRLYATVGAYGESAAEGYLGSSSVELPLHPFMLRGGISARNAGNLSTPIGTLKNSESENVDYSIGGSGFVGEDFLGASFHNYALKYGVPGGFVGAHPNGVDIEMLRRQYNLHAKTVFESGFFENLEFRAGRVFYRHKEFESSGRLGSEYRIVNYLGRLQLNHRTADPLKGGSVGASFEYRDFEIGGNVFTPPSTSLNLAAFLYERLSMGRLGFELAARVNHDRVTPNRDILDSEIGPIVAREFTTLSASVSALWQLDDEMNVGVNLNRTSRVPTIEELYSRGPHLAAYSYETGNPGLPSESGYGIEVFAFYKSERLSGLITAFGNSMNRYIIPRNTGDTNFATFLPIYATEAVAALLYGFEAEIEWNIRETLALKSALSYTISEFKNGAAPLPQIPPLKGSVGLRYTSGQFSLGLDCELAADQNKVDMFETPTAGYAVWNTDAQYSILSEGFIHSISLHLDNFTNAEYRNHLSRVKSILPEAGRGVRLSYKLFIDAAWR